jgi:hypothetical protein
VGPSQEERRLFHIDSPSNRIFRHWRQDSFRK